ncbi:hypothetical protein BKA80DRAFT_263968 [Phyllosticta citrichinensis]
MCQSAENQSLIGAKREAFKTSPKQSACHTRVLLLTNLGVEQPTRPTTSPRLSAPPPLLVHARPPFQKTHGHPHLLGTMARSPVSLLTTLLPKLEKAIATMTPRWLLHLTKNSRRTCEVARPRAHSVPAVRLAVFVDESSVESTRESYHRTRRKQKRMGA